MTVREAAAKLEVSAGTVYALCEAKVLRHSRIGVGRGVIRIDPEAIDEYKKRCESGPPKPQPAPPPAPATPPKLKHLRYPA